MRNRAETNRFADLVVPSIIVASLLVVLFEPAGLACGYDENATEEAEISLVREAVELDATDTIFRVEDDLKTDYVVVSCDVFGLDKAGYERYVATKLFQIKCQNLINTISESKLLMISGAVSFLLFQSLLFKKEIFGKNTSSTITFALFVGGLLYGLAG